MRDGDEIRRWHSRSGGLERGASNLAVVDAGVIGTRTVGGTPDLVVWNGVSGTWLHIQY